MQKLNRILESMMLIAIIFGIPLFFIQEIQQNKRSRIEHTVNVAIEFQSASMMLARYALAEPWLEYDLAAFAASSPPPAVVDKFVNDIVRKHPNTRKSLYIVNEFYFSVLACVENNACDRDVAQKLFGPFAVDVYCLYQTQFRIFEEKFKLRDFGKGIKHYAIQAGGCH